MKKKHKARIVDMWNTENGEWANRSGHKVQRRGIDRQRWD